MLKKIILIVLLLVLIGGGVFFKRLVDEAERSQKMDLAFTPPDTGKLNSCGEAPNCVSSSAAKDDSHFVAPFDCPAESSWEKLLEKLPSLGLEIKVRSGNYAHLVYKSDVFEFIDDIELFYDPQAKLIQIRSASRVGYSDMGANKARYEQIKNLFSTL